MIQYVIKDNKITRQIDHVICNKCGVSCIVYEAEAELPGEVYKEFEAVELDHCWGYYSKNDLDRHVSHLCENCYLDFMSTFKIPPTITEYIGKQIESTLTLDAGGW